MALPSERLRPEAASRAGILPKGNCKRKRGSKLVSESQPQTRQESERTDLGKELLRLVGLAKGERGVLELEAGVGGDGDDRASLERLLSRGVELSGGHLVYKRGRKGKEGEREERGWWVVLEEEQALNEVLSSRAFSSRSAAPRWPPHGRLFFFSHRRIGGSPRARGAQPANVCCSTGCRPRMERVKEFIDKEEAARPACEPDGANTKLR